MHEQNIKIGTADEQNIQRIKEAAAARKILKERQAQEAAEKKAADEKAAKERAEKRGSFKDKFSMFGQ